MAGDIKETGSYTELEHRSEFGHTCFGPMDGQYCAKTGAIFLIFVGAVFTTLCALDPKCSTGVLAGAIALTAVGISIPVGISAYNRSEQRARESRQRRAESANTRSNLSFLSDPLPPHLSHIGAGKLEEGYGTVNPLQNPG